jgi:parallel beta-helix repeat protein
MTEIRVSNRSELLSALDRAQGGDTIVVADGDYGSLSIGANYGSMVTLRAETPLGAKLDGLVVSGASNLRFDGFHVRSDSNGFDNGGVVNINGGSANIQFVNSEVHARIDDVFFGYQGIQVRGASNVLLENNYVHNVHHGLVGWDVDGLEFIGNKIDYVGEDHMKLAAVNGGRIEGNVGGGNVFPVPGDPHPDFIQFQASSSNIEIRDNVHFAKTIAWSQGIFLWDGTYDNITIEGNIISTGMLRGVSVQRGDNIVVQNNTLLNVPGEVHNGTVVLVPDGSVVRGNIQTSYAGGLDDDNLTLQNVDPGRPFYVGDYFVNGMNGRALTIEDLEPVAGSLAETMGAAATLRNWSSDAPVVSNAEPAVAVPASAVAAAEQVVIAAEEPDFVFRHAEEINFSGRQRDIVNVEHSEALEIEEGTIGVGFNAATVRGTQGLISKDAEGFEGGGNHLTAYLQNGVLRLRVEDEDSSAMLSVRGIRANRDYEVVASFAEDDIRLYLDGRLVDEADFTIDWHKNPQYLQVGGTGWSSASGSDAADNPFHGTISELAIWNRAVTPEELDQLV